MKEKKIDDREIEKELKKLADFLSKKLGLPENLKHIDIDEIESEEDAQYTYPTTVIPGVVSQNNIFYSGMTLKEIGIINKSASSPNAAVDENNLTNNKTLNNNATSAMGQLETTKETTEQVPKDFIFKGGVEGNSKDLMVINATSGEVKVKKLKAETIEADNIVGQQNLDYISKVDGSVIIRLG